MTPPRTRPAVVAFDVNETLLDLAPVAATLVEFGGRIGVMWSSQRAHSVDFSEHAPGDPVTSWSATVTTTVPGPGQADDHLNIKSLQSDDRGRLFAVIKTSLEATGSSRCATPGNSRSPRAITSGSTSIAAAASDAAIAL